MIRAAFYGRYSSHAQNDASIEQQLDDVKDYCAKNEYQLVAEYADRALTGTKDDRPQFQKMIKDSAKGGWSVLVCWKSDRFARNRYDAAMYKRQLQHNGVKIMYAKEQIPDGPEGIILESLLDGLAEYYSANLAQNVTRGMRAGAVQCKVLGALPYGYKKGADGKYAINEEAAAVVREVFRDYTAGTPPARIIENLTARGICTKEGARFSPNTITKILRNEKYIGVYTFGDIRIPGGIPAIVDTDIYERAQHMVDKKKQAPGRGRVVDYTLTGKLYCGLCGATMTGTAATSHTGTPYYYYSCSGRRTGTECAQKAVKKEWIEKFVLDTIKNDLLTDEVIQTAAQACEDLQKKERASDEIKQIEQHIGKLDKEISNYIDALGKLGGDEELIERIAQRKQERMGAEQRLLKVRGPDGIVPKEWIVFWLEKVREEAVYSQDLTSPVLDIFVKRVDLSDKMRITCNIREGENVEISKKIEDGEEAFFAFSPFGGPSGT